MSDTADLEGLEDARGAEGSLHGEDSPTGAGGAPSAPVPPAPAEPSSSAVPAAPAAPEAAAGWASAREYAAKELGWAGATAYADDAAFVQALAAQAQQAQAAQQAAQAAATQQAVLVEQLRQLQAATAAAQPAQPAAPAWWNPPEYNPSWESMIVRDASGGLTLRPGAPADVLPKYLEYHAYRRDFAEKFLSDPGKALAPLIQEAVQSQAQQLLDSHLKAYDAQSYSRNFVATNAAWLHQHDVAGNPLRDPVTGAPVLSPAGARFRDYVLQAESLGIQDIRQQENYARGLLQRDMALEQLQAAPAAPAALDPVTAANRRPNQAGTLLAQQPGQLPPYNPSLSLKEQLAMAFAQNGITASDLEPGGQ